MTPAEAIETALREHMTVRLDRTRMEDTQRGRPIRLSGAEAEDGARIALDALAGAGLVVVSAHDLRTYLDKSTAVYKAAWDACTRLRAALPERKSP